MKTIILVIFILIAGINWQVQASVQDKMAQSNPVNYFSIVGHIHSKDGAVIVDASIIIERLDTNIKYESTTKSDGSFSLSIPNIPGTYIVQVNCEGFRSQQLIFENQGDFNCVKTDYSLMLTGSEDETETDNIDRQQPQPLPYKELNIPLY